MKTMDMRAKQDLDLYLGLALMILTRPIVPLVGWLLKRDHSPKPRRNIYFLKMLGAGSLVQAFPSLLGLRKAYPGLPLILVTTPAVAPFAEALGLFDRILVIDDRSWTRLLASSVKVWLGCLGSDTVVDLEVYSMLTTVFSLFTLARNRIGFYLHNVFWRLHLSTHLVFFNRFSGGYHFYDQIAELLGAAPAPAEECRRQLEKGLPPAPKPAQSPARRIGIGHSCSDLARERMLTPAQWRSVSEERHARSTPVEFHFFGTSSDRADADEIIRALAEAGPLSRCVNHCGENSLKETISLIASLDEYWGIDSALLHVARVLGIPCLSFWGPTDPAGYLRPFAGLKETVLYKKISCSPCVHIAETPPCRGNNLCIQRLFKEGAPLPENPTWVVKAAG